MRRAWHAALRARNGVSLDGLLLYILIGILALLTLLNWLGSFRCSPILGCPWEKDAAAPLLLLLARLCRRP